MVEEAVMEAAALGRPFQLGTLYDCRNDKIIPGITLWDQDHLRKNIHSCSKNNTEFRVTTSDTIDDKISALKVDGSLKVSLLAGLVNVDGAAKYFRDTKKSNKQARLTLQYCSTTRYEELTMDHMALDKISHPNVFESDTATHVVTAVLYGADAYFVFDREVSSNESKEKIEGELSLTLSKLKFLNVSGEASLNMGDSEIETAEKFTCTFHGDFKLAANPSSFKEAMHVYTNLPNMLGENGEHAVPLRVWLYPLVKLDSRAARLQRDISTHLITDTVKTVEALSMAEIECNDLLREKVANTFPVFHRKVEDLKQKCQQQKLSLTKELGLILPSIRGGGKEESILAELLERHEQSPFCNTAINQWLSEKKKESNTVKTFLQQLQNMGVGLDEKLDVLLSDLSLENVACFAFTSLEQPDAFLSKLSNYLKSKPGMKTPEHISETQLSNLGWLNTDVRQKMRSKLQLFKVMKESIISDTTKFIVTSKHDENHPGACILVYENGSEEAICFVPPSQPICSCSDPPSYHEAKLKVPPPCSATVEFKLEYRMQSDNDWRTLSVPKNQEEVTLPGLKSNTVYEIRCVAVGKLGYSVNSDVITLKTPPKVSPPTKLRTSDVKPCSVTLTWSEPSFQGCDFVSEYIIEYKQEKDKEWQQKNTMKETYVFTLDSLQQNTTYEIRMFTKCGDNVSGPSEVLQVETKEVILKVQVEGDPKNYTLLASGKPSVYKVNLEDQSRSQFCQHSFGRPSHLNIKKKTIMLLGATGSGKTTLINGMINYILGVKWEDECRFKLIDEVTNKTQAQSQTSEVTAYRIHHRKGFQIDHSLTIIDTPGFGDTRGIKQDKAITDRIREFFSHKDGIAELDAVCFVVQSALARLTHTQKYIFEAILSIFGKDVADNIVVLVTFADGQTPPVLEAIKSAEIPCAKKNDGSLMYFKFNNSALFAPNNTDGEDNFDEMFWKMGTVSMQKFFVHLSSMKTQSLQMTKEVLTERNKLEVTAAGLQPMIQVGLGKLDEIKSTEAALKQHIECIEANKNFEYEVETFKQDKIDLARGTHVTNCLTCNHTCHYPCGIPKDEDKSGCWAMTNSYCRICPGKCIWNVHHNVPYRFEVSKVKKKCTYENLKKQYENALGEKMSKEKIFKRLETDYEQVQVQVHDMINDLSTCLKRLKEIALRPDPLATPDYIDLMIQSEEQEAKPGFQKRIKELTEIRQKAVIMQKLVNGEILSPQDKTSLGKIKEAKEKCTKFSKGVFNTIAQWFQ